MLKTVAIDNFSYTSVPIYMFYNENLLSHGTAFFYKTKTYTYLVTNLHNLSGKNLNNGQSLNKNGAVPNMITFASYVDTGAGHKCEWVLVRLFDQNDNPAWINHENTKIDVALLKIGTPYDMRVFPMNEEKQYNMSIDVGMEVFVLGFPVKMFTKTIPIWKRATIASEYRFNIDGMPQFLIDTATYKGMSGSPVILRSGPIYISENEGTCFTSGRGVSPTMFIGIYSGRYTLETSDEKDIAKAHLGIVWKKEVIDEIIDYHNNR